MKQIEHTAQQINEKKENGKKILYIKIMAPKCSVEWKTGLRRRRRRRRCSRALENIA